MNHNVNCGLGVIMMCRCRVMLGNKCTTQCTTLGGDVDDRKATNVSGCRGKSVYHPFNFVINLKLL